MTGGSAVQPAASTAIIGKNGAKALQYKNKPRESQCKAFCMMFLVLGVVCGIALLQFGKKKEMGITDFNECFFKMDNCSTIERCENTVESFLCIPCPLYHVPTADGLNCILDYPLDHAPSENGETCSIACRSNYVKTSDGFRCKADVCAPSGQLFGEQKINSIEGGLRHEVMSGDHFGASIARMGDIDGNGAVDFAVGSSQYQATVVTRGFGSVQIILLNADDTVLSYSTIGMSFNGAHTVGGLKTPLERNDYFGVSLACLGDLDGDGVSDLIVGAPGDDDGGGRMRGALYVLFMLATGTVKAQQKISSTDGGLLEFVHLVDDARFGFAVSAVGGVDRENGVVSVVVGTGEWTGDQPWSVIDGTVYFMDLNLDGTVQRVVEVMRSEGAGILRDLAVLGDVDGNGVVDIVVGAPGHEVPSKRSRGTVTLLLMASSSHSNGAGVKGKNTILSGGLPTTYAFGWSVAGLGDLDGDGVPDLAVGALGKQSFPWGEIHLVRLTPDGGVKGRNAIISRSKGGLVGPLSPWDGFGSAVATSVERGDSEVGLVKLVVGASKDPATMEEGGAVYILTVPPGFVEVCPGENEKCINSGDDAYTCGSVSPK